MRNQHATLNKWSAQDFSPRISHEKQRSETAQATERERKCHAAFTARFPESNSLIARLGGSSGELCEHHFLCTVEVCYSDTLGNGQKVSL